jgi:transposase
VRTLSALVSEALRANPCRGNVFVFRIRRMDRVKLLAWDGSGMAPVTKWLPRDAAPCRASGFV